MVLLASEYDKSKYLTANELSDGERKFKVRKVTVEEVGKEEKLVVWFTNHKKGLVLNKTNNRVLRKEFGDDVAGWEEKIFALFAMDGVFFQGKPTQGLRVRILLPKQPSTKPSSTTYMSRGQETQPLGNGGSAAAKSANKKPANKKKPPARDELDEVIDPQPPPQDSGDDELNDDIDL
jgi:hypothetical protein